MFCSDTDECTEVSKTEATHSNSNKETDQHEEPCNPFCSCVCCAHIFSPNSLLNNLAVVKPVTKKQQQFFYNNISLSSYYFGNIWQPPKTA